MSVVGMLWGEEPAEVWPTPVIVIWSVSFAAALFRRGAVGPVEGTRANPRGMTAPTKVAFVLVDVRSLMVSPFPDTNCGAAKNREAALLASGSMVYPPLAFKLAEMNPRSEPLAALIPNFPV